MPKRRICLILALAMCLAFAFPALADEAKLLDSYDLISPLDNGCCAVRKDGLWGIADETGAETLPPQLIGEPEFEDGYVAAESTLGRPRMLSGIVGESYEGRWGVVDARGNICVPFEYDGVELSEGIALAWREEQYLYLNLQGQPLNGERYDFARAFRGGYAVVCKETGGEWRYGVIDARGETTVPLRFADIQLGDDGPALARLPGEGARWGYIDMRGEFVIEPKYLAANAFVDGTAIVCGADSMEGDDGWGYYSDWGLIDAQGNELLPATYDSLYMYGDGYVEALDGDTRRYFRIEDGKAEEVQLAPDEALPGDSLAENTLRQLTEIEPLSVADSPRLARGRGGDGELFVERRDGRWYLTDAGGAAVPDMAFLKEPMFEDGLAAVCVQTGEVTRGFSEEEVYRILWGVVDQTGKVCIPFEYDSLTLSEGIALVRDGDAYIFLNARDGEPLNGERYFRAEAFRDGYAQVAEKYERAEDESLPFDALWGAIDRTGAQVVPFEYGYLELGDGGTAVMSYEGGSTDSELGCIGMDGKPLFDARYDHLGTFIGEYAVVGEQVERADPGDSDPVDVRRGVVDRQGNVVLPLEYDEIYVYEGDLYRAKQGDEVHWFHLTGGAAEEIEALY